ncbi:formate--tetrahydrofolate ligase [Candidatus Hakubella thermalkaliphila]|uniref:Formate--tetrahydrofolate ligase n=6 Tax=Candidatus Hakubella thermalkaliphila TaxID=2754717 RepID=A0A6V8PDB0_9ACTN|nr:formate--tetrahydrofolate ligase [Candidatus Hakubella thermalkaliphila]MBT9171296.1 Formate--tetrahydrofolate ligase [Actinomycetota bacterium]GFP19587.1 formate--tetrahydrofolate ligase [Candidatus Hakubella thermalkaliphila]GFP30323.1 formate--tetrahydrofolate ligase [Candidatus Hakubella thermalkaliphila]GFP36918.1 formate--tetrahydrofolate ligase [Candidatus Hakubella thermalkaliphila]GFP43432.1 formate--tetrahydrofolate ligase [Candidatus Hakubella thermalkaliphila]
MKPDIEIARETQMKPIVEVARSIGLDEDDLELYGKYKAKVLLEVLEKLKDRPNGKYIDVTAITPTPLGEGKTVTTIGLSMALNCIGKKAVTCIRQPSLGPVFGIKGGAAGGGYSQVLPMEDFNLHLTGDVHAVGLAHNLLAAFIDTHIMKDNALGIDPLSITWRRVVDVSDRALRHIVTGLGGKENGLPRETGYDITVASEVMAILALTTGLFDLRQRLARIIIGTNYNGGAVTAEDLKCAGSMTVLLKDAIKPNLLQTIEHTPCFVHTGPFANIAHGNNSILADQMAVKMGEYTVTESGFGADCGAEKFFNIKCRYSGLKPDAVVIVATVRALKMHGGGFKFPPGHAPDKETIERENVEAVEKGCENLEKHIENVLLHGVPVVVAINHFDSDTDAEIETIRKRAIAAGAEDAVVSQVWAKGGEGGVDLAKAVVKAAEKPSQFRFLYPLEASIKEKIEIIATKVYGAEGVDYLPLAEEKIQLYTRLGYDRLPLCMAKTHLSLSHDPRLMNRPTGFRVPIRDVRASVGAGFLYPLLGEMRTMPGLPTVPAGTKVDIDEKGNVVGLF